MHRNITLLGALFFTVTVWASEGDSAPLPETLFFEWHPSKGPKVAYNVPEQEDQHRMIFLPGVKRGGSYPVVIAFHGQPKGDRDPREYQFLKNVPKIVTAAFAKENLRPFVLILPVFRFKGQNWPGFDALEFKRDTKKILEKQGIGTTDWYAFGHSGAAGCGGDGLNKIHRLSPKAVGFFDTCLGKEWQSEIRRLTKKKIETVNIHSVETAGFRPKQFPEYQTTFDFGRAYGPLGLSPVPCPDGPPGERLREQPYRCAATKDGVIKGFVVDTGEGHPAHVAVLEVAVPYFLKRYLSR